MNASSFSPSEYYWSECDPYNDGSGGPSAGLLILLITFPFEFIVGVPSNLWLTCHILRQRSKVDGVLPADFFPFHLALTQLSFYLAVPLFFTNHFLWQSNDVMNGVTSLNSMVIVMKPLLLCLVCVERYMAVVRPLDYPRWGCLGVVWCIYIIVTYFAIIERSVIILFVLFLPVLAVDTFCSLSILNALKRPPPGDRGVMGRKKEGEEEGETGQKGSSGVGKMEDGEKEQSRMKEGSKDEGKKVGRSEPSGTGLMNSTKKKAFVTIAVIQAVLALNYVPFILTWLMGGRVPARTLTCQLGRLPCMMSQNP
ncbi:hypothetical protein VZT92_016979 [Zoarces viviparus]|uniref:G-protein coupled receptors family 1 profile domain-containing protein n=1 Tax=Zoarces viviparus TaxID=48416 RepID=A0AAW1EPD8_ZOAVI